MRANTHTHVRYTRTQSVEKKKKLPKKSQQNSSALTVRYIDQTNYTGRKYTQKFRFSYTNVDRQTDKLIDVYYEYIGWRANNENTVLVYRRRSGVNRPMVWWNLNYHFAPLSRLRCEPKITYNLTVTLIYLLWTSWWWLWELAGENFPRIWHAAN